MLSEISIRKRLLVGVIGTIFLSWFVVIGLVYKSSHNEIGEIYDASLASYARVLTELMAHEAMEEQLLMERFQQLVDEIGIEAVQQSKVLSGFLAKYQSPDATEDYLSLDLTKSVRGHEYESKKAFLVKALDGQVLLRSSANVPFQTIVDGYQTALIGGERWRLFGLTEPENAIAIMVGENIEVRTELQNEIIINTIWPFLAMLPFIALIILVVINQGLKPLQSVAEKVSKRSPSSLDGLRLDAVPVEVLPIVKELNQLFERIRQALDNERRFTSNAAHELRTPLAVLKTHVQVLQMKANDELQPTISRLLNGIDRATHMVEQLLTLARSEAKELEGVTFVELDLVSLTRSVMTDYANLALEKNITLSFEDNTENSLVNGDKALIESVIRNLVDNAVRYTPVDGSINVSIGKTPDGLQLRIEDTGPGIDPAKKELMFQRFQRGNGNGEQGVGLGLFIVKQIIELHHIEFSIENATPTGGLIVRLGFKQ